MVLRSIIKIDEEKCDGCGLCIPACPEGALKIVDGKVRLVSEKYCDGLGACVGRCPRGALTIEVREAEEFDEEAVKKSVSKHEAEAASVEALVNWPVKLRLVNPAAPFFRSGELLIAADCVPFAHPGFHRELLRGRVVVSGCPKFDDVNLYIRKLEEAFRLNGVRMVEVVRMEVPCCRGLMLIAEKALEASGRRAELKETVVGVRGGVLSSTHGWGVGCV